MKFTLLPQTGSGKTAAVLGILFTVLIVLKILVGFPLPSFLIAAIGISGFLLAIIAIFKKDWSVGAIFALLVGLGIGAVLVAIGISSLGLFKDFPVRDSLTQAEAGKPVEGTVNLGRNAESGGLIYYLMEDKLYHRQYDWTEPVQVSDHPVATFQIIDGWIYYLDSDDGGSLYKMKQDGSQNSLISGDHIGGFAVSGSSLFYSTMLSVDEMNALKDQIKEGENSGKVNDKLESSNDLYRISTDGSGKVKLVSDGTAPQVIGEWVYYYNSAGNLFRIKTDGSEEKKIAGQAMFLYSFGGYLYIAYFEPLDESGAERIFLYRLKPDGSEKTKITAIDRVIYYTFDSGYFYYGLGKPSGQNEDGLYRLNLDGTGRQKMNEVAIWSLDSVAGDWMYISDYGGPRFRVRLDGAVGVRIQ